jgi:hypothetical protein
LVCFFAFSIAFAIVALLEEAVVELQRAARTGGQVQAAQDDRDVPNDVPPGHARTGASAAEAAAVDREAASLRLGEPEDEDAGGPAPWPAPSPR